MRRAFHRRGDAPSPRGIWPRLRLAMSTPVSLRISTMRVVAEHRFLIRLAFDQRLDAGGRTLSADECASPPLDEAIEAVKKNFSSNTPRGVAIVFVGGHPADRGFVHADGRRPRSSGSAGRRLLDPGKRENPSCWRTISGGHLEDGLGPADRGCALASWLAPGIPKRRSFS